VPAFLPTGARFAVLQGNPGEAGVFTIRLEMPVGYVVPPHWHPTDEHVTVLSGKLRIGMGDVVDTTAAMILGPGEFITAAAEAHHYAMAVGKAVVQVHGMGPFAITYVNPADDPRPEKTNP
ncbi:MAG: cupin domain-containing protein, partial [Gemmatimonadales bacterium]